MSGTIPPSRWGPQYGGIVMAPVHPQLDFLITASNPALESFELSHLNRRAILRKEAHEIMDKWADAEVEARFARWILDCRRAGNAGSFDRPSLAEHSPDLFPFHARNPFARQRSRRKLERPHNPTAHREQARQRTTNRARHANCFACRTKAGRGKPNSSSAAYDAVRPCILLRGLAFSHPTQACSGSKPAPPRSSPAPSSAPPRQPEPT
jgi:hypothetical protein